MSKEIEVKYSKDDELYQRFGKDFIRALHHGVEIATGKRQGRPAREMVEELIQYVEEEKLREQQGI